MAHQGCRKCDPLQSDDWHGEPALLTSRRRKPLNESLEPFSFVIVLPSQVPEPLRLSTGPADPDPPLGHFSGTVMPQTPRPDGRPEVAEPLIPIQLIVMGVIAIVVVVMAWLYHG